MELDRADKSISFLKQMPYKCVHVTLTTGYYVKFFETQIAGGYLYLEMWSYLVSHTKISQQSTECGHWYLGGNMVIKSSE